MLLYAYRNGMFQFALNDELASVIKRIQLCIVTSVVRNHVSLILLKITRISTYIRKTLLFHLLRLSQFTFMG